MNQTVVVAIDHSLQAENAVRCMTGCVVLNRNCCFSFRTKWTAVRVVGLMASIIRCMFSKHGIQKVGSSSMSYVGQVFYPYKPGLY